MGLSTAFSESLPEFTDEDLDYLRTLLDESSYDMRQREYLLARINTETDVDELERIKQDLYHNNLGIEGRVNYNQSDINRHLRKFIKL